jgi:2-phospho-L-lactate guanylyltransferase
MVTPVKRLERAKSRLAARLSAAERERLVFAMFLDLLGAARRCRDLAGICIVTDDARVAAAAHRHGAVVVLDAGVGGLSQAYASGIARAVALGAEGVLLVPGDVPLVRPRDLSALVRRRGQLPLIRLVPARQDPGTNAMFLWPAGIVPPRYEGHSFAGHMAAAIVRGLEPEIVTNPRLALDIDRPDDLMALHVHPPGPRTRRVLADLAGPGPAADKNAGAGTFNATR